MRILFQWLLGALVFFSLKTVAFGQMWNGTDTLYGNEWIDFSRNYYKVRVAADGVYRITYEDMLAAGIPADAISADQFRLYQFGKQVPVYLSAAGALSAGDFIEFFGEKNRETLDRFLFENPDDEIVNPEYSLFNDTSAYYLTWENTGAPMRYAGVPNDLQNAPAAEPWVWFNAESVSVSSYLKRRIAPEVTYSWFNGEGYNLGASTNRVVNLPVNKASANGPNAGLRIRYACELGDHVQNILLNDSLLATDSFNGWRVVDRSFDVSVAQVKPSTKVSVVSVLGGADRNHLALIRMRYARETDFENAAFAAFEMDAAPGRRFLFLKNLKDEGNPPIVYDLAHNIRMEGAWDGKDVKFVLPEAPSARKIVVNTAAVTALKPEPVSFRNFTGENADFIIVTNRRFFADPLQNNANHVEAYADYRRSAAGGGHRVAVVDVDELYEQFGYGVRYHLQPVRNFVHWAEKNWDDPRYLLFIGKGMSYEGFRTAAAQKTFADSIYFVPTYGFFGADLLFGMKGASLNKPVVAIGRLAVEKPFEIRNYLNKLIEYEQELAAQPQTIDGKSWSKRVVQNSGGINNEQLVLRNYSKELADVLEQGRFGAEVFQYFKTSNDPIQFTSYEQMVDLINDGVALWMIYGHSSAFAVDFDIGSVSSYSNKRRYPVMMVNGCFSGRCVSPQKGMGEEFVLSPDRGAIAFFASVHYSFIDALYLYTRNLYERMAGQDYGAGIGEIIQNNTGDLQSTVYSALVALAHQYQLQGDPAVRLHTHDGPDYVVDLQSVQVSPNPVALEAGSYNVAFEVRNLGENVPGTLDLSLSQALPDNALLDRLLDSIPAPGNRFVVNYQVNNAGSQPGFNRLFVQVDPQNKIAELPAAAEQNNDLRDAQGQPGIDVYFFANDVQPLHPEPYAIVRKPDVILTASTFSTNAPQQRYFFELDTAFNFDSPFKKSALVDQKGGILSWQPPVTWKDSTVYFWRIGRDSLVGGAIPWRQRSFVYLPGSAPGWNQSIYGQYRENNLVNLVKKDDQQEITFSDNAVSMSVSVAYRNVNRYMGFQNTYYEGFYGDYGWNIRGVSKGCGVAMIDPLTGRFVKDPPGSPTNPDSLAGKFYFWFNTYDSLQRIALMDFIENKIPDGYLAGFIAFNNSVDSVGYDPRAWAKDSVSYGKNLFQMLEAQGAKNVRDLPNYTKAPWAYGFIFQKNSPQYPAVDTVVRVLTDQFEIRGTVDVKWPTGAYETPQIGPAEKWASLHWRPGARDNAQEEETLTLYGVRGNNLPDTVLMELQSAADTSLQMFSTAEFPYLRLRYDGLDTFNRTYTPTGYLRVLYEGIPEGALAPQSGFSFYADTLQEGETLRATMDFVNVSAWDMDSMLVSYRIEDGGNQQQSVWTRYEPLPSGDTLKTGLSFDTRQLTNGPQRLYIDVNPNNDQPEKYHFNNVWVRDFYTTADNRNPLLDVTFDGMHILNGDLVSPSPEIMISLKDENPYLPMSDTSTFSLQLEYPDGKRVPISFNSPEVLFFPADPAQLPQKNTARLEWRPHFDTDGTYRLVVNGRDATGNTSAGLDYSISFQVVTQASLGNVLNYPNPFSTSTCFVYTMTGNEPPVRFNLQIMTVSGRVVREVTQMEFGDFKTGTHKSDFCWDGKDQFGDQLANGVYLYRIIAQKADGSSYPLREDARIDGYFKNGFGKMVLIR